jgi:SH3-like domain-containing protein
MRKFLFCLFVITLSLVFFNNADALCVKVPNDALCVKVPKANLREGPGTKFEKTWHVFKYMPFKKVGSKGSWYKVEDVDGDTHWIYSKLVTNATNCAVVKVDEANVRSGPGTNFPKKDFSPALKYDSFKVLKSDGKWIKLVDEFGNKGWVFRKLVWVY